MKTQYVMMSLILVSFVYIHLTYCEEIQTPNLATGCSLTDILNRYSVIATYVSLYGAMY